MVYILALELFLSRLRANLVLHDLTLPGVSVVARYTVEDISLLVISTAEVVGPCETTCSMSSERGKSLIMVLCTQDEVLQ